MLLLDTNVVSELRKIDAGRGDPTVRRWQASVEAADLYVSAITLEELERGISLTARHDEHQGGLLRAWFAERVLPGFAGRLLPVDGSVALWAASRRVPDPSPFATL